MPRPRLPYAPQLARATPSNWRRAVVALLACALVGPGCTGEASWKQWVGPPDAAAPATPDALARPVIPDAGRGPGGAAPDTTAETDGAGTDGGLALPWVPGLCPDPEPMTCDPEAQLALFEARILPLMQEDTPTSCNQCHLAGVDLSLFLQPTPCGTMACLDSLGFVDLACPSDSALLEWVRKAEPASGLITAGVLAEEHDALLEWIRWSAACQAEVCGPVADPCGGAAVGPTPEPPELSPLGSCEEEALAQSFEDLVYTWQGRCHGCHENCEPDWPAPCWLHATDKGAPAEAVSAASLLTMYDLVMLGAIDVDAPLDSPMLTKPLAVAWGGEPHGGGDKFQDDSDPSYQDYALFAERYAACFHGEALNRPVVSMTSPGPGALVWFDGEPVVLSGSAEDAQDGAITGDALTWTAERVADSAGERVDGPDQGLGVGPAPEPVALPGGTWIVRLTATDSEGHSGYRAAKIKVKPAPVP